MSTNPVTRIKNDSNGNPRRVIHFLEFITPAESAKRGADWIPVSQKYEIALSRARKFGGRKFHNKQFGGGIVFQAYTDQEVLDIASECIARAESEIANLAKS